MIHVGVGIVDHLPNPLDWYDDPDVIQNPLCSGMKLSRRFCNEGIVEMDTLS